MNVAVVFRIGDSVFQGGDAQAVQASHLLYRSGPGPEKYREKVDRLAFDLHQPAGRIVPRRRGQIGRGIAVSRVPKYPNETGEGCL